MSLPLIWFGSQCSASPECSPRAPVSWLTKQSPSTQTMACSCASCPSSCEGQPVFPPHTASPSPSVRNTFSQRAPSRGSSRTHKCWREIPAWRGSPLPPRPLPCGSPTVFRSLADSAARQSMSVQGGPAMHWALTWVLSVRGCVGLCTSRNSLLDW